jgi:hypothetical protein
MAQRWIGQTAGLLAILLTIACGGGSDQPPAVTSPTPSGLAPVLPPLTVERLDLERPSIDGGQSTNATVVLTREAPAQGTVVALSSSDPAASVPASITVPAGQGSATFQVTTRDVDGDTPVTISAATSGLPPREATVSVNSQLRLESFSRVSPYVRGGRLGSITIRLPARASRRLVMRIASTNPSVVAPQTVTMEAGTPVLNYEFSTPFVHQDAETILSTTVGGQPFSQQIVVNPAPSLEFTNGGGGAIPSGRTRFDADNNILRSTTCCRATQILADFNYGYGRGYLVYFRVGRDSVINPGTYESGTGINIPGFSLVSDGGDQSCPGGGTNRVQVLRASFQPSGVINRFHATFEQRCTSGGTVTGEISLDAMSPPPYANLTCGC